MYPRLARGPLSDHWYRLPQLLHCTRHPIPGPIPIYYSRVNSLLPAPRPTLPVLLTAWCSTWECATQDLVFNLGTAAAGVPLPPTCPTDLCCFHIITKWLYLYEKQYIILVMHILKTLQSKQNDKHSVFEELRVKLEIKTVKFSKFSKSLRSSLRDKMKTFCFFLMKFLIYNHTYYG